MTEPIDLEAIRRDHDVACDYHQLRMTISHRQRGQLIAEVERLREDNRRLMAKSGEPEGYWAIWRIAGELSAENERLRARVAELERDAARYRWLRDDESSFAVMLPREHGHIAFGGEALDSKIDAAMSEGER